MRTESHRPRSTVAKTGSDSSNEDDMLVIGIDFGTTYSGVAWATQADFEEQQHINLITSWPRSGREEGKAPTEVYYEDGKISCEEDPPPSRKEDSVKRFIIIECKTNIPYSGLESDRNSKGESFKKLWFDVRMVPSGAAVEFAVFANGKRIGSSNVQIHCK